MKPAVRYMMTGGLVDPVEATIRKYGTPAFYLGDPNPALRTPSGLYRGYKDFANTPALVTTDTVALAMGLSEGAAIGAELNAFAGFPSWAGDDPDGYAVSNEDASNFITEHASGARIVSDNSANVNLLRNQTVSGAGIFKVTIRKSNHVAGLVRCSVTGTNFVSQTAFNIVNSDADGTYSFFLRATGAGSGNVTIFRYNLGNTDYVIEEFSIKPISGNHFFQETSADEPTLTYANGLWSYVGDGLSKHFKNNLVPSSTAGTLMAAGTIIANSSFMGARDGTSTNRLFMGTDASGNFGGGLGTDGYVTIHGSTIITGTFGIMAMVYDASTVAAYWKPLSGPLALQYSGSRNGNPTTTYGLALLGVNTAGSIDSLNSGKVPRAIHHPGVRYTLPEITAIADQWSRELASLI